MSPRRYYDCGRPVAVPHQHEGVVFSDPPVPFINAPAVDRSMGAQFRFVHCADLHLGARFKGVARADPEEAARMTRTVFESFSRIVDTAVREGADAMFVSGDAFDEDTITPRTRMFLCDELRRAGMPVFVVRGNHDPRTSWESSIPYPGNVHEFGTEPERVDIPGVDGAEAIGASFADWHDSRNLPSMMTGSPDRFTVACVHCDVDNPGAEYQYSPCSLSDMRGRGVDYWALGHIHKRQVLSTDPWVVYPGNIQGRSFRETGEKGAYLVDVRDGRVADARFFATQGMVWHDESVDITDRTIDAVADELAQRITKGSIARVTFTGSGELDGMVRSAADDIARLLSGKLGCAISEVVAETSPAIDLEARRGGKDMVSAVLASGDSLRAAGRDAILGAISMNAMARDRMDFYRSMSDDDLAGIVDSAVKSLVSRMEAPR